MPHISLRHWSLSYGGHRALHDISCDIPDQQVTAILGPSGCGKTSLLKSLNRLVDLQEQVQTAGEVLVDGENIYHPAADVLALRQKIGYIAQRPFPLPMSIRDNVAFGPRIHGLRPETLLPRLEQLIAAHQLGELITPGLVSAAHRRTRATTTLLVEVYLRLAGLWDEVKDRLHEPAARLSVGQQQRLALARTLAVEPLVILADEPTSALDPVSARRFEERCRFLKQHYAIVMVTHILRQAKRMAEYVLFLYLGELVEHGPAEQFFNAPRDPRTRAYLSGEMS